MIPLFIPYVNRIDLLQKATKSIPPNKVNLYVLNNSDRPLGLYSFSLKPTVPLTFTQTQNWMMKLAAKDPYYLFMHSDAEAGEDTIAQLIHLANKCEKQERRWGVIFTAYDALAAFNTTAFREVGGWDTMLEWYCSDNDMYRRIKLAGYELIESDLPVKHEPSQTLKSDPEIMRRVDMMIPFREAYYRAKWGGAPGAEVFETEFNRPRPIS